MTTGSFLGHYRVPAPPALAAAAQFSVSEVTWTVAGNTATLHYDLPTGLVGGDLSMTLSGPITAGSTTVQLTSALGAGACIAQGTQITCSEAFDNLGTLPISLAVVEQVAAIEYPGPVANRVAVATSFSSDPIGTVDFDLSSPADDGGHGGGGGGGGGGGHH